MGSTSRESQLWAGRSRRFAQRHLPVMHFLVDSLVWVIAIPVATWLRYDYDFGALEWSLLVPVLLAVPQEFDPAVDRHLLGDNEMQSAPSAS